MTDSSQTNDMKSLSARSQNSGGENVIDLISRLTSQGAHLAQQQVALMQAEIREGASDIGKAMSAYASAAVFGLSGLGVTLLGLGWWLGDFMDNVPLGIVIVGVVTLVIAAILYGSAKSKMKAAHLKPDRSIRTLQDTPEIVTGAHPTMPKEATL